MTPLHIAVLLYETGNQITTFIGLNAGLNISTSVQSKFCERLEFFCIFKEFLEDCPLLCITKTNRFFFDFFCIILQKILNFSEQPKKLNKKIVMGVKQI